MSNADPSRRDVLRVRIGGDLKETHVSSLVLHVRSENVAKVREALVNMPGIEVPACSGGKLVVTLETDSEADIVSRMNEISLLPGVLSVALVFHHFEAEPIPDSEQG